MNFFRDLGTREKFFVTGAAVALLLTMGYLLLIEPLLARAARLDRQITATQLQLEDMHRFQREYRRYKQVLDGINTQLTQQRGFSLFSRLEELAGKTDTRDTIDYIRPTVGIPSDLYEEHSVEIKMEGVTLQQLVRYLYEVESSPQFMKVKRLFIKPRLDNRQLLTAIIRVSTFTPKDGAS